MNWRPQWPRRARLRLLNGKPAMPAAERVGFTVGIYSDRPAGSNVQEPLLASPSRAKGLPPASHQPSELTLTLLELGDDALAPPSLHIHQWLVLLSLNVIGPFASDAYLPNLPDIRRDLVTSSENASLTIQVNWVVLGLINPVIGSLSDRFGRKLVTAGSLLAFVVGAVGSALAPTLESLMFARVIMGCGQAVSVVPTAILRDLVDDPQERLRVTSIFQTLQPLAIVAAPSLGGIVGDIFGWRVVFACLGCWGCVTMCLVSTFIPESNQQFLSRQNMGVSDSDDLETSFLGAAPDGTPAALAELEQSVLTKICRSWCGELKQRQELFAHSQYMRLTVTAGLFMAGVRSMLATISFVYSEFYCVQVFYIGILTAVPTAAGIGSSMLAGSLARKHATDNLLQYGMAAGCFAPVCLFVGGLPSVAAQSWLCVAGPCAVMSATGFFVLPAMQVLILEDFKHMSGFAGGMSKLIMTLLSTGGSMSVSYFYAAADIDLENSGHAGVISDHKLAGLSGSDSTAAVNLTRTVCEAGISEVTVVGQSPPGFLLWALCAFMIATQICYWQWLCATRLRAKRGIVVSQFTP